MDGTTVIVALIAATPPTLAIIAGHLRTGHKLNRTEQKVDDAASLMVDTDRRVQGIEHAVNNQPSEAPTLVAKIDTLGQQVGTIDQKMTITNERLTKLERKVG